jgi:thioesterase domain-containing protein
MDYRPRPYGGSATFIAATGAPSGDDVSAPLPAWRRLVRGPLAVEHVPGGHDNFIAEPHVDHVAEVIAAQLDR